MALSTKIRSKIVSSTQDHLEVADIIDDIILTKTGSANIVLQTNAVNFALLSEVEQDNKIMSFAGLLNSLNFHIQILIKTQRIDITKYLNYLAKESDREMSEGLKEQLTIYTKFVENLIVTNDVLDKKFYIAIPYNPSVPTSVGAELKKSKEVKVDLSDKRKAYLVEQGKIFLYPKRDHVLKQLARMGLSGHHLQNDELIRLFYNLYNPDE